MKKTISSIALTLFLSQMAGQSQANWRIVGKDSIEAEYNWFAFNSVFNIPAIRYNINTLDGKSDPPGSMEYFNSLGAGVSISYGKINMRTKNNTNLNSTLDSDRTISMKNICGLSIGVLFSKSGEVAGNRVIFAPTVNLQLLDFQIGWGYELGTVLNNAHRNFLTISYGLPISKFADSGSVLIPRKVRTSGTNNSKQMNGVF